MAILEEQLNSLQQQPIVEQQQPRVAPALQHQPRNVPIVIKEMTYDSKGSWKYDFNEEAFVERRPHRKQKNMHPYRAKPSSLLSIELERVDWPPKLKLLASLLEYDCESDARQFVLQYNVMITSGAGNKVAKAKAVIMALKGSTQ